jgi:hypothetical protein
MALAATSSGAVTGKMISPQNIAVGVTTVGLAGNEGGNFARGFLAQHSICDSPEFARLRTSLRSAVDAALASGSPCD